MFYYERLVRGIGYNFALMRWGSLVASIVGAAALVVAAALVSVGCQDRAEGPGVTIAVWGGAEEMGQFRTRVLASVRHCLEGVRIEVIYVPRDYYIKLATLMAAGDAPDLFYLADEYIPQYAELGALLDVTRLVDGDDDPAVDLEDYYPEILANYRWKGRLYGLPWIAQPVVLYCNEALFRQAGVDLPDGQWRWRQFAEAAKALTRDVDGDGRADQWGFILNGWPPFEMFVWQNGAAVLDAEMQQVRLTDPGCVAAAQFYADLIHKYKAAPPLEVVTEQGFSDLFRAGKVAMFMGGAADELDSAAGLEVAVREVPAGPDRIRATFAWNAGLCISSATGDRALAYKAWKLFLDAIQQWKVPAPRRSLAARLEQFEPRKAHAAEVIRRSMQYMRPLRIIERQRQWETIMTEEFEEPLLRGSGKAQGLAGRASRQLQMLLR